MRGPVNRAQLERFMELLGRAADREARVYLTGGTTALLEGWRDSTVDIDIRIEPESDRLFRAIPEIKERLNLNIELASPIDFIPPDEGWSARYPALDPVGFRRAVEAVVAAAAEA